MSFWAAAQLQVNREQLALHFLKLEGFETYTPRIRISRRGARDITQFLFPSYSFVRIELQWHAARWAPGVIRLVMSGGTSPAKVPARVIDDLKARERNGLVELPKPERFRPGTRVRIVHGLLLGQVGLVAGLKPRERVEVLLQLLGAPRSVILPTGNIAAME
jgi:transcription antitermination factor NusG